VAREEARAGAAREEARSRCRSEPYARRSGPIEAEQQETFDTGLPPDAARRPAPIHTPWGSYSIFALEGGFSAVQSFCPHLAGPLFQGTRSDGEITCPWHRWRFSLRTGERVDVRDADRRHALSVCAVRVGPRGSLVLSRPERRIDAASGEGA
jgi:nitrite reductase/ring-hydroxylating ferredoxin subunit